MLHGNLSNGLTFRDLGRQLRALPRGRGKPDRTEGKSDRRGRGEGAEIDV